jgi:L-fuculose-phosphate aldolase
MLNPKTIHPADQLAMVMDRVYRYGLTTTSGGNISVRDGAGNVWITPSGVDKGALTRDDMMQIKSDGAVLGKHQPSVELPFHTLIYQKRPDLKAVIHAHPTALVAFSIIRKCARTDLFCHPDYQPSEIAMAGYALPGSRELGEKIAALFAAGKNAVMMENHGLVAGGGDLFEAYHRLETLEYCARIEIEARRAGNPARPAAAASGVFDPTPVRCWLEFTPESISGEEGKARGEICKLTRRAYDQRLFISTWGTFSRRLGEETFVITPRLFDRMLVEETDLVRIDGRSREAGKEPPAAVLLHQRIYARNPRVRSIITATPPYAMAFAVTGASFDPRLISESYMILRQAPLLPFDSDLTAVVKAITPEVPVLILAGQGVVVTGNSPLQAFDRLEVLEYSAKAALAAQSLGETVALDAPALAEIERVYPI